MADDDKRPRDSRDGDGARGDRASSGGPRKPGGPGGGKPRSRGFGGASGGSTSGGGRSDGGKPGAAGRGAGRPASSRSGDDKPAWKTRDEGSDRPAWKKRDDGAGKPAWKKRDDGAGKPAWKKRDEGSDRPAWKKRDESASAGRSGGSRPPRADGPRDDDARPRHDDPVIPEDVAANQLDRAARTELKTLSKDNADWVARHLVMAGRLIDTDVALAHRHALAAARRAGRIGVVRETTAITAYATGDFALALRELRTYRRITGRDDQLPLMVDSERGVGRPQQALELGRSVPRAELEPAVQASLAIAMSGARLDLGQPELALSELEIPQLDPEVAFSYSPALFDAYATVLEELGRTAEAEVWWERAERASIALEEAATPDGQDTVEVIEEIIDEPVDVVVDASDAPQPAQESDTVETREAPAVAETAESAESAGTPDAIEGSDTAEAPDAPEGSEA
jgi:hypothetical protein